MRLGDVSSACVDIQAERETYDDGAKGEEIWVTLEIHVRSFLATGASCIDRWSWQEFLADLARLEERRTGEATLRSVVDGELSLRLYALGHAGHMAIDGELARADVPGEPRLGFRAIEFDPSLLPGLLRELRAGTTAGA